MATRAIIDTLPLRSRTDPCCGPVATPSLTEAQTESLAERLRVLGDPTRLRMLDLLVQGTEPLCVCDLTAQFPQNQPTISHHLRLLRGAGLIDTEKRGIWAYYWATEAGRRTLSAIHALL
jgi:ArsR family transcriptional regulator